MATTQKRKAVSKTRKRTITIEDEVLSLASSPMTKTVKPKKKTTQSKAKKPVAKKVSVKSTAQKKTTAKKTVATKKVAAKKPTTKKVVAKKTPARKTTVKKSTARAVRTRKPATIRQTIAAEMRAVETETKQIAKSPTVHKMVRFSELYVLSVLITVIIVTTVAWTRALLSLIA